MNLVTYNILNNRLATREVFYYCQDKFLSFEYREKNIKKVLEEFISKNTIICLQEIGRDWTSILLPFFLKNNYYYIHEWYGEYYNDFMGIAIAFPMNKYQIIDYKSSRIGDEILQDVDESVISRVSGMKYEDISIAINRKNRAQFIKLIDTQSQKTYRICNYHMPCAYKNPIVMLLHSYYYIQFGIQVNKENKQDKKDEFIYFCGDFNIIPNSDPYKLLTGDKVTNISNRLTLSKFLSNKVNVLGLKSLYKLYNGKEPDFTNYVLKKSTEIEGENDVFRETLDYIFLYHPKINMENISLKLKGEVFTNNTANPIPDRENSSDHLYVFAQEIEISI